MKKFRLVTLLAASLAASCVLGAGCNGSENATNVTSTTTTGSSTVSTSTAPATTTGSVGDTPATTTAGSATATTGSAPKTPPTAAATATASGAGSADSPASGSGPKVSRTAAPGATAPKAGDPVAILDTDKGRIVVKFFSNKAPNHVKNFIKLAEKGFYDGTKFHRTIPGFMIQGGDPNTKKSDRSVWGQGGPGYTVKAEFNDIHHARGILSMARAQDPNSAGSQFFIMVADNSGLDGQYTVFGQVIEGMDVVDKIVNLPSDPNNNGMAINPVTIKKVTVKKWPIPLKK